MKIFEVTRSTARSPSKESIRRALLDPKFIRTNVVKSIPLLANAWFAWCAAENVIKGDWIGAAIDAVGIFAGPWKQVVAFTYDLARKFYADEYYGPDAPPMILEKDMAADPEGTQAKLNHLAEIIQDVIYDLVTGTAQKAKEAKKEFGSTGGGAAVGNPNIAAQGARAGATQ